MSPEEVRALVGTPKLMVGYWPFDEGGGTNIWDPSSQTNHGTLIHLHLRTNTWTGAVKRR